MSKKVGTPVWVDYGSNNFQACTDFYQQLFGWRFEDLGAEFNSYNLVHCGDALVGGLIALAMMSLLPVHPIKRARRETASLLGVSSSILREVAEGLESRDVDRIGDALQSARDTQPALDTLREQVGGGKEIIKLGERCLLGANSGLGIPLGDDCVLEAGLYLTAGTKVTGPDGTQVKARDLAGQSNLLFRRNSVTGAVEVVPWKSEGVELNAALHKN